MRLWGCWSSSQSVVWYWGIGKDRRYCYARSRTCSHPLGILANLSTALWSGFSFGTVFMLKVKGSNISSSWTLSRILILFTRSIHSSALMRAWLSFSCVHCLKKIYRKSPLSLQIVLHYLHRSHVLHGGHQKLLLLFLTLKNQLLALVKLCCLPMVNNNRLSPSLAAHWSRCCRWPRTKLCIFMHIHAFAHSCQPCLHRFFLETKNRLGKSQYLRYYMDYQKLFLQFTEYPFYKISLIHFSSTLNYYLQLSINMVTLFFSSATWQWQPWWSLLSLLLTSLFKTPQRQLSTKSGELGGLNCPEYCHSVRTGVNG